MKNPFNYIGGKFKLLEQIYPYFPTNINTFYDIFGGGGDVSFNLKNFNKIEFFDKNEQLINIYNHLDNNFIKNIEKYIKNYNLSKTNKESYLELRKLYNEKYKDNFDYESAVILYTLMAYGFNNFINFNKKKEFNIPFGMNRSSFNDSLKEKLSNYIDFINKNKNIINFHYKDFNDIDINKINSNDFVYLDPPYLITTGAYERSYDLKWSIQKEKELYNFILELNKKNIKFILSNVTEHKGKINNLLIDFVKENNFKLINLDFNYKNCVYQNKNNDKKTSEVIIKNF